MNIENPLPASETYPSYDALWHLKTLGVLAADSAPNGWSVERCDPPTRVAIIDTSVAVEHPNLVGVVNRDLSLDLFSARLGSFSCFMDGKQPIGNLPLEWETDISDGLPHARRLLTEFVDRLSIGSTAHYRGIKPCVSPTFSTHGTCVAGLVGARPSIAAQVDITGHISQLPLPYMGVDPTCEIVQISTNFDPHPESLLLAFLYAHLIKADLILLPRAIPDPSRIVPELTDVMVGQQDLQQATRRVPLKPEEKEMWTELAQLIVAVSKQCPVICAAGNANEENAIYPANLATDHNGIISVGAINAKGYRSSYSSPESATVFAPSNDAEVFDRVEVRLDEMRPDYDAVGVPDTNSNHKFSSFDVIATDVPGRGGYSSSPFQQEYPDMRLREFGSYFCRFGGTSAAAALVCGFLSLAISTGRLVKSDGLVAKAWLLANSHLISSDTGDMMMPSWTGTPEFPDGPQTVCRVGAI
ncbi:S8 family serine peptidase [Paracoccus sp. 11-3]|uniref:S8 family serine peptidase n=1 Tax=Paracoccus amoyensis TaxID=2760093 RepID=A0A926J4K9_9RHOB|nr:S8 family serine peptidase [Paracoccus amoyensis]MBC9245137.1 S8 family serine peptidase [Paracoccus amoyensis]